jgi:hypothetical protein
LSKRAKKALTPDERLAELVSDLQRQYQNYSDSVLIISGLHDYFSATDAPAKFVGTNLPLVRLDKPESPPPRPDLVLQSWDDRTGVCIELKWSVSSELPLLRKEVVDTLRYLQPRKGWETADGRMEKVEAFFVVPRDDCSRILQAGDPEINRILSEQLGLLSWDFSRTKGPERLCVQKNAGPQSFLDDTFSPPGLELPASTMTDALAKILFYGAQPPLVYSMEKIYILANATKGFDMISDVEIRIRTGHYFKEGILVSAKELYAEAASFFPSWERIDQDIPQLRLRWVQEALVGLAQIDMAIPVVGIRPFGGSGNYFLRVSTPGWEMNSAQLFFIPSRGRGMGLRSHVVQSYARYLVRREENQQLGFA